MSYTPRVDDYVKFRNVEGWVYFVCSDYLTIEISVKDKSEESYKDSSLHKKVHCLIDQSLILFGLIIPLSFIVQRKLFCFQKHFVVQFQFKHSFIP